MAHGSGGYCLPPAGTGASHSLSLSNSGPTRCSSQIHISVPPLPPVPPVPLRHDGTDHLPAQGFAYGSVGGASTFRGVQTARAGFRGLVCCAVPFKPVVERACKARASLPHPASTVGQAVLRSDIRAVVVPARDCVAGFTHATEGRSSPLPRKTVGPSRTASRSLCIARTSIGCVLCHGSRWTRTSFFSVSADMFTRAGNTAVQDRGRLAARAAPRARRERWSATQVDRAEPAPQQACRFTTRDSDTAQIRS